ncbi:MAG TPA: 30S ribosomal protein S6 [Hyphomicrobium sp.]|jgi:small subunit ribosomal protein S6
MALYEHVFLARQDVSNAQVEALTKEFTDLIEQGGGKVTKSEYWGVKGLAYKIKKSRKAHFSLLNIDAPPAAVAEMERRMGLSTEVLRYLTVKVEAHETEPSVMMRKSDRDERGDRGDRGGFGGRGGGFGGRGGGGGFGGRGGDRDRGGGGGGFRSGGGDREGSTFRARPPRDGDRPPRDGDRPPREGDRGPRPPRDGGTGGTGGSSSGSGPSGSEA